MKVIHSQSKSASIGNVGMLDDQVKGEPVKFFLHEELGLTGMEASVTGYPPNHSFHLFHSHKENEELYIVTKGEGEMQLDDEIFPIKEGTVIRVEPNVMRNLRSGPNSCLQFICIQAKMNSLRQFNAPDVTFLKREFAAVSAN